MVAVASDAVEIDRPGVGRRLVGVGKIQCAKITTTAVEKITVSVAGAVRGLASDGDTARAGPPSDRRFEVVAGRRKRERVQFRRDAPLGLPTLIAHEDGVAEHGVAEQNRAQLEGVCPGHVPVRAEAVLRLHRKLVGDGVDGQADRMVEVVSDNQGIGRTERGVGRVAVVGGGTCQTGVSRCRGNDLALT